MIDHDFKDGTTLITLNRTERRNALDTEHCLSLGHALRDAVTAGSRSIVVTGAGTAFCAGADLDQEYDVAFRDALYGAFAIICTVPVPVIACVNGPAIGAGTQLAIACDLRVVAPSAVFSVPTASNGLAVDPWTIRRLAMLAGGGTAGALLLGNERISAEQALTRGLADRAGSHADAMAWAAQLAKLAPLSLAYSKNALAAVGADIDARPDLIAAFEACWDSEDVREARRARAECRNPVFTGR